MLNQEVQGKEAPKNQLLNQEQQKTIDNISILLANNNKEFSTINDLLNKEFLKGISTELAGQILDSIPDSLQNDPNIQKVVIVLRAKTSASEISGNNSKLEDYSNNRGTDLKVSGSIDIGNLTIDLSTYKKDISGNSELYGLTGLTGEIQQCLYFVGSSKNLQNLKNNLEGIKKILEGKFTKLNDLNKIEQFLTNNQIKLESWNENNIAPLLQGIHTFILNIAPKLSHNKSSQQLADRILDEEEQRIKTEKEVADLERIERNIKLIEMSTAFSDIENKIPNDLGSLSKLNKKDIQNIKDFITESKSKDNISTHISAKESVFILYLKMYHCQQALNGSGITHRDRNNFDEVFKHITETFKDNEIQNYELGLQFKGINETNLKNKAPENWNGKDLNKDDEAVKVMCKGHLFKPEDYAKEFNSKNEIRIKNIIDQLNNYDITKFLNDFKLKNDGIEGEATYLVPKNDEENFNKLDNNAKTIKVRGMLTKNVTSDIKNLVNGETELKRIIGMNQDKTNLNILDNWTKKIIEELNKQSGVAEGSNAQPENALTELKDKLDPKEITNLRSGLREEDVADFFNKTVKKDGLTEDQTKLLLWAQKGLTVKKEENDDIKALQEKLGFTGNAVDGKFGKNTFRALKVALGEEIQPQGERVVPQNRGNRLGEVTVTPENEASKIDQLGLNELTIDNNQRKYYNLPLDAKIFVDQDNLNNGYYYVNNSNQLIFIPKFTEDSNRNLNKKTQYQFYKYVRNLSDLSNISDIRDTSSAIKEYPNISQEGVQYLNNLLRNTISSDDSLKKLSVQVKGEYRSKYVTLLEATKIKGYYNGKYVVESFGKEIGIDLKTITDGWIFEGNLGKDLALLSRGNDFIGGSANNYYIADSHDGRQKDVLRGSVKGTSLTWTYSLDSRGMDKNQKEKFAKYLTDKISNRQ